MRTTSRYVLTRLVLGAALATAALPALAPVGAGGAVPDGRWRLRGRGIGAEAIWTARPDAPHLRLRCDQGDPVLVLEIGPSTLPRSASQVRLVADATGMEYPMQRDGSKLVSRIALDAPILDRMLLAQRFAVSAGGITVVTGAPGDALAHVVRTCRALHWPREAWARPANG
jgi:hypothetical protein